MKRLLSLTMAGILMFSATAFGADLTVEEVEQQYGGFLEANADNSYSVPYSSAEKGKEYMIWVLKGLKAPTDTLSFAQTDVMYIDQQTGTDSGVAFNNFLPMESVNSTVVITGQDMDEPEIVGYIEGYIKVEGRNIEGEINLIGGSANNLDGVTVMLADPAAPNVALYTATTGKDGKFTINDVADGTYRLVVSINGYLSYTDMSFDVDENASWSAKVELTPGDFNQNTFVDNDDLDVFKKAYGKMGTSLITDFNRNGFVDNDDLDAFKKAYGKMATTIR